MKHEVSEAQLHKKVLARSQKRYDLLEEKAALPNMIRKTVERLAALRARKKQMPAAIEKATSDWEYAKKRWWRQRDKERTVRKIGTAQVRIRKLRKQLGKTDPPPTGDQ